MSRTNAIARALAYFDDEAGYFADLARRIAIPTECQEPSRLPNLYRYLEDEMRPAFESIGYTCTVYDNPVEGIGPVLLATRIEDPALPTVLGYGHGDVIRGYDSQWRKGLSPWRLVREGDTVYGRGTADNKGQHSVHIGALKAVLAERGRLGFNSKFMIETGEENGSRGLKELVAKHREAFAADAFIASDGPRVNVNRPNLELGSRGCMNFDLAITLRKGGHHSGNWGGLLANPGVILAHALATIVSDKGRILIKEWLPGPIPNSVRVALKGIEREVGEDAPEIDPEWGEPGLTSAEKVYGWNTFEVLAFRTGNPDNPVNAIPPRAIANCQIRYVVGSKPDDFLPALRRHLDAHGFDAIEIQPPPAGNAGGFAAARTDPDDPWVEWAAAAVARTTGEEPAILPNSGGSICNDVFRDVLGVPTVWIPLSYGGCSQHAPGEHILWPVVREGMQIVAGVYWDLGEPGTPAPTSTGAEGRRP
ncbi:MAG TPA: M20 family metallopeptidase [Rhodospirillales bacterium]|jgi:acetylornithine deacetylase/succinyl-diaminopimelate desuccinylase-like protein